jgi:hypothetical protein
MSRVEDNVAETPGDLMFITGDEIVVLKQLEGDDAYLVSFETAVHGKVGMDGR